MELRSKLCDVVPDTFGVLKKDQDAVALKLLNVFNFVQIRKILHNIRPEEKLFKQAQTAIAEDFQVDLEVTKSQQMSLSMASRLIVEQQKRDRAKSMNWEIEPIGILHVSIGGIMNLGRNIQTLVRITHGIKIHESEMHAKSAHPTFNERFTFNIREEKTRAPVIIEVKTPGAVAGQSLVGALELAVPKENAESKPNYYELKIKSKKLE
eukprot:UN23062